jgi:transcriptional regulator with XRE-family HTH domain
MGKRNIHDDNPLQYIRLRTGLGQHAFADALGMSRSNLGKLESSQSGFERLSKDLFRKLAREFGAFIITDFRKQPGEPGYYRTPTGLGGVPYTAEYAQDHMRNRLKLVSHAPAEVVKALDVVGKIAVQMKRESQFADSLAVAIKGLCMSPRLKIAVVAEIKKLIADKEFTAASWLCNVIEDDELRKKIPVLPSMLEHQQKFVAKLKEKFPGAGIIVNGEAI